MPFVAFRRSLFVRVTLIVTISALLIPSMLSWDGATHDAKAATTLTWRHLSTTTGDLPQPTSSTQQTASLILDVDKDGRNDFVIAARRAPGPSMVWYRRTNSGWTKYLIDKTVLNIEAGGAFHDIDGDGDLDVLMAGDNASNQVWWWENPYPSYAVNTGWTRRLVKDSGSAKHHDQLFGDVDGDGRVELVMWNQGAKQLLLAEIPANPKNVASWPTTVIYSWSSGAEHEGLALGDVNGDGKLDIVGGGRWFKHTGGVNFTPNIIDDSQRFSRVAVGQLVAGGGEEVVFVSGDGIGPIKWYSLSGSKWTAHSLLNVNVDHGHSLQIADVNRDGHADIFNAEMRLNGGNSDAKMRIWLGNGSGNFTLHTVASGYGNHEARLGDLDGDGDLDILGKPYNWTTPRLDVWLNESACNAIEPNWPTHLIDGARPERAVFVLPADLNGDGWPDVVSGAWWYRNPGTAGGSWARRTIGNSFNQVAAVHDFDNDGDLDLLGTVRNGQPHIGDAFVWARNNGAGTFTVFDNIDAGDGDFLQGVAVDDFNGDGLWEVALSWHQAGKGIQLLTVPANPATGRWRRSLASSTSLDEQISAGDIDRDGDPDLLLGTTWLRNDRSGGNTSWWDGARAYRVPITVSANGQSRTDAVGEMSINFTQLLAQVGESGAVDVDALRLAEVNAQGAVIAGDVPFQFEQAANFNATNNASGVLTVLLSGNTGASTTRRYHLYFAKTSAGLPDTQVTPRVRVADNVQDQGQASFKVTTADAIYFYHKNGGGFSSLIDLHDNANVDWIGYDQGVAGAGGTYRGIPNLVRPAEGGHFHPGNTTAVTTLVSAGPLKVTLESKVGSQWTTRWEIFPGYARMTVIKAAASYWFLYEGTPGGQLDLNSDLVVRSNGASNTAGGSWAADINAPEWVAIADPGLGHSLFLAHMDDDSAVDSYRPLDGLMTVFGFGRNGNSALMRGAPNTFAMGLLDTVNFATTAQQIAAHTQPLSASVGSGERLSAGNVTWRAQTLSNAGGSPDRNRLADMNGDGRLDAVVGYEAINKAGKLAWYQQPSNVTGLWTEIVIANDVIGPMSLDVKDMDGDGDMDVVVGEHNLTNPASARLLLFENQNGTGRSWTRHVLATGHEHHDGAQLVDIDRNGAQDVISIGWGHNDVLLYTNPSTLCGGGAATPTPRPTSIPTAQPTARPTTGPQNTATPTATDLPPGPCNDTAGNIVGNPSFEQALERWSWYSNGRAAINGNSPGIHCARAAAIEISAQGTNVQLYQTGLPLMPNTPYRLRFAAKSSTGHDVSVHLHQHANGTTNYGLNGVVFDLSSGWQNFEVDFTTTGSANNNSRLRFWLAPYDANGDSYWFDNITLVRLDQNPATATPTPQPAATETPTPKPAATDTPTPPRAATNTPTSAPAATQPPTPAATATSTPSAGAAGCNATPGNLVVNPSIEATLDAWRWYSDARSSLSLTDEALHCATAALITVNTQGSNVQFYQTGLPVEPNTLYRLHFAAKSNSGHDVSVYLHQHANGTTNYGLNNVVFDLTTQWQEFEVDFTTNARADSNSRLRFWLAPFDANGDSYWFDNITLVRVEQTPATDTPTPEPVDTETPTPEPVDTATPTPEPVNTETPTPEPVDTETPTPEPAATETPTPEPVDTETPTPEPVSADPCTVPGDNLLANGGLDDGESGWKRFTDGNVGLTITDGDFCGNAIRIDINRAGTKSQLYQNPIALVPGRAYRLTFAAKSSTGHDIMLYLHKHSAGGSASYGIREAVFDLTEQWQTFTVDFTATDIASNDGRLRFWFPPFDQDSDVYWFDNLVLQEHTD